MGLEEFDTADAAGDETVGDVAEGEAVKIGGVLAICGALTEVGNADGSVLIGAVEAILVDGTVTALLLMPVAVGAVGIWRNA